MEAGGLLPDVTEFTGKQKKSRGGARPEPHYYCVELEMLYNWKESLEAWFGIQQPK